MPRPNILLITADDLNWDSVGCFGAAVTTATPNIDRLAATGLRFEHAHVTCAVCMPSRSTLATGRYPHHHGIEGFVSKRLQPGTPTIMGMLADSGYRTGILGKLEHSSAGYEKHWDVAHDFADLDRGRSPERYGELVSQFLTSNDDRPFYLMVNSHDPHRPFYGSDQEAAAWKDPTPRPSRVYGDTEVMIPGFLPELPAIRKEVSEYLSSVRRCDDTVGAVLDALEASGLAENTLVCFLSDNGMAFPFAKTNCYLHSTKTPWIVRLPGATRAASVDSKHFISGIDWLPTVADLCGVSIPVDTDGRSFFPLLRGEHQTERDHVFTEFNETSGKRSYPMRCVQDGRYGYIFNAWSDGTRPFQNESQSGRSWKAMQKAAHHDPEIAARVHLFTHRVPEELYDFSSDPDALQNLIDDPAHAPVRDRLRALLEVHLSTSKDWAADCFAQRHDESALQRLIDAKQASIR
jgi:N-sulfoglucosamine sulfohydrolase